MHAAILLLIPFIPVQTPPPKAKIDYEARARIIAPYLDPATVAVARVDVSRLDVDALLNEVAALAPAKPAELAALRGWVKYFRGIRGKEIYAVVSLADLPGYPVFLVVPLEGAVNARALEALFTMRVPPLEQAAQVGSAVVVGRKETLDRLRKLKPDQRPELVQAFAQAGDAAAQVLILPPSHARRMLEETYPTLPRELGGGPTSALTRGLLWAAITVELKPKLAFRGVIQAQDAKAAQGLADLRRNVLSQLIEASLRGEPSLPVLLPADLFKPKVVRDQLLVSMDEDQIQSVLKPLVRQALDTAARAQDVNAWKQLGLALHNYHDTHGSFPATASFDKQGKPLLSWRVHILPFLEQDNLYKQFRLDEPWDNEHNKKLIPLMPAVLAAPGSKAAMGKTPYLAPVSPAAIFTGGPKGTSFTDITDGTSNTIMLVQVDDEHAVIWTKPDDWKIAPANPLKGLRVHGSDKFLTLFADGSVRTLPAKLDPKTLRALFTRSGGEVISIP